jgi:hypothetical protein
MSRTTLSTTDGGQIVFGIDRPLGCWFAMVFEPGADEPHVYEPDTGKDTVIGLIRAHAVPGPETERNLALVALDLDRGEERG